MPAATAASRGAAAETASVGPRGARGPLRRAAFPVRSLNGGRETGAASVRGLDDNQKAPAAAPMLSATPTHVVPRRPNAGISQKPAATAPSVAPPVFAA